MVFKRETRTNIACFPLHLFVLAENLSFPAAYQLLKMPGPATFSGFKIWPN